MSPWIEQPPPRCTHPTRPKQPDLRHEDRVWECEDCGQRWRVRVIDHGHDVELGERQLEAVWVKAGFRREEPPLPPAADMRGRRFGELFVVGPRNSDGSWTCICDCGGGRRATTVELIGGAVVTCGTTQHNWIKDRRDQSQG